MARITEKELILPSLYLLNIEENKTLSTTDLISKLRVLLKPDDEDLEIISGRSDDKFSQKVRNLKSHNTLTNSNFCTYQDNHFTLNDIGEEYLIRNLHLLNAILPLEDYYIEFKESILNIQNLSNVSCINESLKSHYFGMLYSSVITSLETYLYDAIRFKIDNNIEFLEVFVKTFEKYQKEKVKFSDIYTEYSNIELKVKESLSNLIYHRLDIIENIYSAVFSISFQEKDFMNNSVQNRHDLVHRNGKKTDGTNHNISKDNVLELCDKTLSFVENIEEQFNTLSSIENNE
jgi:hypothetical protein